MRIQYLTDNQGKKTGVFIPIKDWEALKKQYHLSETPEEEYREPTKEEILQGLKSAMEEVKLHQEGKIKLKSARDFLNEL
ncbi:hypothetical protein [Larkinella soli]|uniref:hypothetical protein n=1 Tax=Larkinella soli TaxID=1770527 RepID=UPI000FFBC76C|nr:hypothetical protein [Larkinella soli]